MLPKLGDIDLLGLVLLPLCNPPCIALICNLLSARKLMYVLAECFLSVKVNLKLLIMTEMILSFLLPKFWVPCVFYTELVGSNRQCCPVYSLDK
jgi:hypothetical protein